jgi:hypothetical protein
VIVAVRVIVIETVIVAVHLNGNDTVAMIRPGEGSAGESSDSGSDHLHGGVHVHVHGHDHVPDHVNVDVDGQVPVTTTAS